LKCPERSSMNDLNSWRLTEPKRIRPQQGRRETERSCFQFLQNHTELIGNSFRIWEFIKRLFTVIAIQRLTRSDSPWGNSSKSAIEQGCHPEQNLTTDCLGRVFTGGLMRGTRRSGSIRRPESARRNSRPVEACSLSREYFGAKPWKGLASMRCKPTLFWIRYRILDSGIQCRTV